MTNYWLEDTFRAHSWEDILRNYHESLQHHWSVGSMIDLVERIIASPYRTGLFGATSHEVLMVFQHRMWGAYVGINQRLVVEPATPIDDRLTFRFQDWSTRTHDGFATLERFLHRVGWFVDYSTPT